MAQAPAAHNLALGANFHAGYLLPQYPFLRPIIDDYVRSAEVTVTRQTTGTNFWHQLYNYPEVGASLFYSTLGNDEHLGRELALTAFVRYYWRAGGRFRVYNRFGIGGTYATRIYNERDNYQNVAIATHLNVHFNLRFGVSLEVDERFDARAGLSFDHLSNANAKEPNRGLNSATAFAGVSYAIAAPPMLTRVELPLIERRNAVALVAYVGRKSSSSAQSKYYPTTALGLEYLRRLSWRFAVGAGVDAMQNGAAEATQINRGEAFAAGDDLRFGVHVSQSVVYRRARFTLQSGVYPTGREVVTRSLFYNRALFEYRVADRYLFRLTMKSYLQVLNYAEFGVGYNLPF